MMGILEKFWTLSTREIEQLSEFVFIDHAFKQFIIQFCPKHCVFTVIKHCEINVLAVSTVT